MRYFILGLFLTGCAYLPSQRTTGNILYGTAITGLAVDWGQTRYIVKNPADHMERNRILGPSASTDQVDAYFSAVILGTAISYPFLKEEWRPYLYGVITALESYCIIHNHTRHVGLDFVAVKFH